MMNTPTYPDSEHDSLAVTDSRTPGSGIGLRPPERCDVRYPRSVLAPQGGEGVKMSIIHAVTVVLARELLKRLDEQPPAEPDQTTSTRIDSD